jgi:fumarylpyruvate hydrolase
MEMDYVIPVPPTPSLAVEGERGRFPVRRIYCMGRQFAEHAKEMGHDPTQPPFVFMKPADAIVADGGDFPYPPKSAEVHHEVELVVALGSGGANVPVERALDLVYGYAVGIDMTRRDIQLKLKKMSRPWEEGKSFDASAPCSPIRRASDIGHPTRGVLTLEVNGTERQRGDFADLRWGVPEIIAHLSTLFELAAGDLIYTGTPPGVNLVQRGDVLKGSVEGVGTLTVRVV